MPPKNAEKRAVVLAAVPVEPALAAYLRPGDFLLACDAGVRNAAVLGVTPDLIIGDFDSAPRPDTAVPVITLPTVKDDTDTHYAARWLLEHGYRDITLLGALGGRRPELTLASYATALYLARGGARVLLADAGCEVRCLVPGAPLTLRQDAARPWAYFSLFAFGGALEGVTIRGAKYPLQNARLTPEYPLGVSNEFAAGTVTLRCTAGCGLVLCTRHSRTPDGAPA